MPDSLWLGQPPRLLIYLAAVAFQIYVALTVPFFLAGERRLNPKHCLLCGEIELNEHNHSRNRLTSNPRYQGLTFALLRLLFLGISLGNWLVTL